jgi:hypothetical protein
VRIFLEEKCLVSYKCDKRAVDGLGRDQEN